MAPRPRRLTAREVVRVLSQNGFELIAQKGSHQKWRHPDTRKQVTVPMHWGRDLPIGTLQAIKKGSGLSEEVWESA